MVQTDVTTRHPATWPVERADDPSGPWTLHQELGADFLFRKYKSASQSTVRNADGGYEYPSEYTRFTYSASGSTGNIIIMQDQFPHDGSNIRYLRYRMPPCTNNYIGSYGGGAEYLGVSNVFPFVPDIPLALSGKVRNKLLGRLRSNSFDAGVSLGEIPDTVNRIGFLANRASSKVNRLKKHGKQGLSLRKTPVRRLRQIGSAAAKGYLGALFGIIPLMRDAYALMDYLENGLSEARLTITVDEKDDTFGPPDNLAYGTSWNGEFVRGMKESLTLGLDNPASFEAWRLGLTNPLSIAWELVSLSFVIDWFTNIGSFIESLTGPLGIHFKHGFTTKYCSVKAEVTCPYGQASGPYETDIDDTPMVTNIYQKGFYRLPLVGIVPTNPFLDLQLNTNQLVTAVALMAAYMG